MLNDRFTVGLADVKMCDCFFPQGWLWKGERVSNIFLCVTLIMTVKTLELTHLSAQKLSCIHFLSFLLL